MYRIEKALDLHFYWSLNVCVSWHDSSWCQLNKSVIYNQIQYFEKWYGASSEKQSKIAAEVTYKARATCISITLNLSLNLHCCN